MVSPEVASKRSASGPFMGLNPLSFQVGALFDLCDIVLNFDFAVLGYVRRVTTRYD
jgi:hypothetical protein